MKHLLALVTVLFLANCQSPQQNPSNEPARAPNALKFTPEELESDDDDVKFAEIMSTLDLENSTVTQTKSDLGKYFFEYKKSSTSAGVKVHLVEEKNGAIDLDKIGKWVPENSANNVEAQVVAYNLARFLKMGDLTVPSAYYTMGPKGLKLFKPMLKCANEKGQHKDNCVKILAAINKNPNAMLGSFVDHVKDEQEVTGMNTFKGNLANNGKLNQSHIIAKFINVKGPMPTDKKMDLGLTFVKKDKTKVKATDTELNLARQFSKIMVLDILTGQWDRFSGGNIEAIYKEKKDVVQFLAIDNGGASMKGAAKLLYWEAVTRFDKATIQRVEHLLQLLKDDKTATVAGLAMKSDAASLIARCEKLVAHVEAQVKAHGEAKAFFPE